MAAARSGYHGTPVIATGEAFLRESALALELIVKAVIAQKIEVGGGAEVVPTTHDVPFLWGKAALPALAVDDRRRLLKVKSLLIWSSRYTAPKTDFQYYKEREYFEALGPAPDYLASFLIGRISIAFTKSPGVSFLSCGHFIICRSRYPSPPGAFRIAAR